MRQFLEVSLGDASQSTPAITKTLNPEWNQSFDLPIVGLQSLLLEAVCWDKDRFGKDYLGEFAIPLDEIFANGQTAQPVGRTSARMVLNLTTIAQMVHVEVKAQDG